MASSSACASSAIHQPKDKYDVFLSFSGADTRQTFTSHLEKALSGKKIETYIDYRLERGDEIAPALPKSNRGIKDFGDHLLRKLCFFRMVLGRTCAYTGMQVVRHQTESYKLEERFKHRSIDKKRRSIWKDALTKAADLSGFDSNATTVRDDSDLIEQIVEYIFKKSNYVASSKSKGLVGVERRIQEIESLLRIVPQDDCVRCVGIWGMGGVGKTTLADALYHRLSSQFDSCCFLANVREASWADGKLSKGKLYDLRNKLLRKLLGNESIDIQSKTIDSTTAMQLSRRKVLVVLDDVNDLSQLEMLAGCDVPFGSGSRIIITTRDMQKLRQTKVGDNHDVEIYEVEKLNGDEAHQLLQLNAPRDISSAADSTEVLRKVVDYAAGIPLALNTWRSLVHKGLWDDVKKSLNEDMESIYRVCYDVLRTNEKEIFLDIACFYKGVERNGAKRHLECCSSSVDNGIKILIDMSMRIINSLGIKILICSLFQGTATIQSIMVPHNSLGEINMTPEVFREMHNLRFLEFDMNQLQTLYFYFSMGFPFEEKYFSLRLLFEEKYFSLRLPQGLESFPRALRYLKWPFYPLKSFPSKFSPGFLVELHMPSSELQTLWNKDQNPCNLKKIDLSKSKQLVDVSNLSRCLNIVSINLEGCDKLVEVSSNFENLHKLTYLNLRRCPRLKSLPVIPRNMEVLLLGTHGRTKCSELPSSIWSLEKLVELDLYGFDRIENLPNSTWRLYSLTSLDFSKMSIEGLPSSIECLSTVLSIRLRECKRLLSLPTSICKLKSLKKLDLSGCSIFKFFPEISDHMEWLEDLNLRGTEITELHKFIGTLVGLKKLKLSKCKSLVSVPDSICKLNRLEDFRLDGCRKLKKLPHSSWVIWSLISELDLSGCTSLEEIPDGLMICLTSLTSLIIWNCASLQSLTELPCLLRILDVDGCTNLRVVSFTTAAVTQGLDQLWDADYPEELYSFRSCINLEENAKSNIIDNAQRRIMRMATAYSKHKQINHEFKSGIGEYSVGMVYPGNEIPPWFRYQTEGSSITIKLPVRPSHTNTNFWQICLCLVLTIEEDEDEDEDEEGEDGDWLRYIQQYIQPKCKSNFTTNNGDSSQFNITMPDHSPFDDTKEDYISLDKSEVFVWYLANWSTHVSNASEASFEFYLDPKYRSPREVEVDRIKVKRCGVCLLNSRGQDVVAVDQDVGEPKPEQVISRKRGRDEYEASGSATVTEF